MGLFIYLMLVLIFNKNSSFQYNVPVGAVFEGNSEDEEIAFQVAIDMINDSKNLSYHLVPLWKRIEVDTVADAQHGLILDYTWEKPFEVIESACSILSSGVVGVLNPLISYNSNTMQSVCDAKGIPVIQTTLNTDHDRRDCCPFNVFPHASVLATAFADVVRRWDWKNFTIIYENQNSLKKITEMLKIYNTTGHSVLVRQLYTTEPGNFRAALKDIWKSGQSNFVMDCSTESLSEVLKQAQQIGLMTFRYSYIIINMNMHTVDLEPYQYSETNITGFRLIDPEDPKVIELAIAVQEKRKQLGYPHDLSAISPSKAAWKIRVRTILVVDAVLLFANVLTKMKHLHATPVLCNSTDSWPHGETIFNYMKWETYEGLTGLIQFDNHGVRSDFGLELIELREDGISKIGTWSRKDGLNISRVSTKIIEIEENSLRNRSFKVAICKTDPYAMLKDTRVKLEGNDQYEGFAIDLIKRLAELEGFNYTFILGTSNGDYNKTTNTWSGMMGDVLSKKADLAIADLTITRLRQQHVDFTNPFMALGILILYATPTPAPPSFFTFASPFHLEVWGLLTVSYFGVSVTLFIMARLCPSEWTNPYPCVEEPEYLFNLFSFRNSLWFNLGGLMQQGSDIAPFGLPTRLLAGFWWFFTLIMVSSYTANLAAFLTSEFPNWPFTNVDELVKRADSLGIKYGALKGGSTYRFFKDSENENYAKIGAYMDSHPEVMVTKNNLGVKKAEQGNYAFFMESSSVEYAIKGSCNLTQVGQNLDEKSYGIAMRKDQPYRNKLSAAVLKLTEMGVIDDLQRKWWEQERKKPQCEEGEEEEEAAPPLNLKHVGGIFWVSIGGTFLAFALVFVELTLHTLKKYGKDRKSCIEEFKDELRFYFTCKGMVKPVKSRKAGSESSGSSKDNYECNELTVPNYGFSPQILTNE